MHKQVTIRNFQAVVEEVRVTDSHNTNMGRLGTVKNFLCGRINSRISSQPLEVAEWKPPGFSSTLTFCKKGMVILDASTPKPGTCIKSNTDVFPIVLRFLRTLQACDDGEPDLWGMQRHLGEKVQDIIFFGFWPRLARSNLR
mmetsp:Transcript_17765/g.41705  ORF Transcript_17765/g.41705 Transcript_17765/m.41705 type:complete len:142 (-) Transcript_17765:205-630(-)